MLSWLGWGGPPGHAKKLLGEELARHTVIKLPAHLLRHERPDESHWLMAVELQGLPQNILHRQRLGLLALCIVPPGHF